MVKPIVIGAATALAAIAIYIAIRERMKQAEKREAVEDNQNVVKAFPNLSKDQLLTVFDSISTQMGQIIVQLAKLEAKIRHESSQNGRSLPKDQLTEYLMGQFEEAMKVIETQVYKQNATTENDVQAATEFYQEEKDEEVAKAVSKLQELYDLLTGCGAKDAEVPDDLTLEKFISIMREVMEALNKTMEETCVEVSALKPDNREYEVNERYTMRAEKLSSEIHAKYGLTHNVLQAAMLKFQHEPEFLSTMTELQVEQTQRFTNAAALLEGQDNSGLTA